MEKRRGLSRYERSKSGPSPEDPTILQVVRELSDQLGSRFWYRQILWAKYSRQGGTWFLPTLVVSKEMELGGIGVPETDLVLPEHLKGKLSLDGWRVLINPYLLRNKAYNSGRMSRILGTMALGILAVLAALLAIFVIFVGKPWGPVLVLPAWTPAILLSLLWTGRKVRRWEFQIDIEVAIKFGTENVLQTLEKVRLLDPRTTRHARFERFVSYFSPTLDDRVTELKKPPPARPPELFRFPSVSLRWRGVLVGVGFANFWASGLVAGLFYGQGRGSFACASNGCAALVMLSAVGYWLAIIAGLSSVYGILQRVRRARWNKKLQSSSKS